MTKLWSMLFVVSMVAGPALAQDLQKLPDSFTDQVQLLSSVPMFLAAEQLGITSIAGKDLTASGSPPGNANAKKLVDVGVGTTPAHENEPSVTANPKDKKKLVAASHRFPVPGVRCVAYRSDDNGATWTGGTLLPQLFGAGCSDPVVAYAPDGSRVYATYMNIIGANWDILVSHSDDDGLTWSAPVIALDGSPAAGTGFQYDKCWIATHGVASDSNWVYVTATKFNFDGSIQIAFARSSDQGASFVGPTIIDSVPPGGPVVQGSRPQGGLAGQAMVAWYHSGADGWLAGGFQIRTRSSSDNGASFGGIAIAAADSFELPYWLGPGNFYHRWWGAMFPDIEIDSKGNAHIAYTHSPCNQGLAACFFGNDSGDIRYVTNESGAWSAPATISDDTTGRAQGYVALKVGNGDQLHAIWEDHRLSPVVVTAFPVSSNLYYDQFYSRRPQGHGWFSNFRVSDTSSINDFVFIGDYVDLAANDTTLFGVWTDRRHQGSIFAFEDNVFGSRIISGGGAP